MDWKSTTTENICLGMRVTLIFGEIRVKDLLQEKSVKGTQWGLNIIPLFLRSPMMSKIFSFTSHWLGKVLSDPEKKKLT